MIKKLLYSIFKINVGNLYKAKYWIMENGDARPCHNADVGRNSSYDITCTHTIPLRTLTLVNLHCAQG